jgi:hypothetical protein
MGRPSMHRTWQLYVFDTDVMASMHNMLSFQHIIFSRSQCHGKHAQHIVCPEETTCAGFPEDTIVNSPSRHVEAWLGRAADQLDVVTCGDAARWGQGEGEGAETTPCMILLILYHKFGWFSKKVILFFIHIDSLLFSSVSLKKQLLPLFLFHFELAGHK